MLRMAGRSYSVSPEKSLPRRYAARSSTENPSSIWNQTLQDCILDRNRNLDRSELGLPSQVCLAAEGSGHKLMGHTDTQHREFDLSHQVRSVSEFDGKPIKRTDALRSTTHNKRIGAHRLELFQWS